MRLALLIALGASLGLQGCASFKLAPHQAGIESISTLRESGITSLAVGEFSLAKSVAPAVDKGLSVRGNSLQSPNDSSFASYLKESLITDLRAAGKLDPKARRVIAGELTESKLNAAGVSQASASLAARFRVTQDGQSLFEKELRVEHSWESAFSGMIAIPAAVEQYTDQYSRLLAQLYRDDEFRKACSMPEESARVFPLEDDSAQ